MYTRPYSPVCVLPPPESYSGRGSESEWPLLRPCLSKRLEPLHLLLQSVRSGSGKIRRLCFPEGKDPLITASVLVHLYTADLVVLAVFASPYGVGAMMVKKAL